MDEAIPLHAMEVRLSKSMVGFKYAVQFGDGPVYVSPAMWDLMSKSTPEELETLLKNLPLKKLPPMPDFRELASQTMFTKPPTAEEFRREILFGAFR